MLNVSFRITWHISWPILPASPPSFKAKNITIPTNKKKKKNASRTYLKIVQVNNTNCKFVIYLFTNYHVVHFPWVNRFLDKACIKTQDHEKESPWRLCTAAQVEQVKSLILVIPIFACTIIFNTVLAQLQTFSVQQGALMDNRLFSGSFKVPPASLQSIPYIILILLVPMYELLFVPFVRGITGHSSGITPLQRIGVGLFTVTFSMVAAAMVIWISLLDSGKKLFFLVQTKTLLLHYKRIIMLAC